MDKQLVIDKFLADFNYQKNCLRASLANVQLGESDNADTVQEQLDRLVVSYDNLKAKANDSVKILPAYHARSVQEDLKMLWTEIETKKDAVKPRKKFAFSKPKAAQIKSAQPAKDEVDRSIDRTTTTLLTHLDVTGICDRHDESICLEGDEVNAKDLRLTNLSTCDVKVIGSASTVFIKSLRDCTVSIGPVKTSVMVDDCVNCKFNLCGQQLRIHTSTHCDFYVLAASKPIIEDCSNVRFGKYNFVYENVGSDLAKCSLDERTSFWNEVVDFNWLSVETPSPNWSTI